MKKKPSFKQVLFSLIILFIICMSPIYLINVYRCTNILVNKDKFELKKYKIDSISTTNVSHGPQDKDDSYVIFFNDKKEKLHIAIVDENRFSFSKRTKNIYTHFIKTVIKENGWLGRLPNDSINVWQGPSTNLYGFENEKEMDFTSYRFKLVLNIFLTLITIISVRYLINFKKNN